MRAGGMLWGWAHGAVLVRAAGTCLVRTSEHLSATKRASTLAIREEAHKIDAEVSVVLCSRLRCSSCAQVESARDVLAIYNDAIYLYISQVESARDLLVVGGGPVAVELAGEVCPVLRPTREGEGCTPAHAGPRRTLRALAQPAHGCGQYRTRGGARRRRGERKRSGAAAPRTAAAPGRGRPRGLCTRASIRCTGRRLVAVGPPGASCLHSVAPVRRRAFFTAYLNRLRGKETERQYTVPRLCRDVPPSASSSLSHVHQRSVAEPCA
jgi:hypothetical protein